ncbi:hypothetical protein [Ekhidna sp.]|uniref:hypothetical protein n=1 Tax=Ekhidna sp. TaxID=2608089 RepID=UPI003B509469
MDSPKLTQKLVSPSVDLIVSNGIKNWKKIDLSDVKGRWIKTKKNVIRQVNETGSRKIGSGTMFLYNKGLKSNSLNLIGLVGSTGQFGLVFNFIDKANFDLFYIDQHTSSYRGFELVISHITNGRARVINRDRFDFEAKPNSNLRIVGEVGKHTRFLMDNQDVYQNDKLLLGDGLKFGLYSQGKTNAIYQNLHEGHFDIKALTQSTNGQGLNKPIASPIEKISTDPTNIEDYRILPYLKLKPPKSKTLVDFSEIYTVPLDSFYERLYKNEQLNTPSITGLLSNVESNVYKLDFRPRRWYRDYKKITDVEKFLEVDVNVFSNKIGELENQLSQISEETEFLAITGLINESREKYLSALQRLNEVREHKVLLLREIRTNGFTIIEDKTPESILNKGYSFHIIGGQPTVKSFTPVPVPYEMDYTNDQEWGKLETKLRKKLLDSSVLTNNQKIKFEEQINQLKDFAGNLRIQSKITAITSELGSLRGQISALGSTTSLQTEKNAWQADKTLLIDEMLKHPTDYYANDFPDQLNGHTYPGNIKGIADSMKFVNWLNLNATKTGVEHPAYVNYNDLRWSPNKYTKKLSQLQIIVGRANNGLTYFAGLYYPDAEVFYHRYFTSTSQNKWQVDPISGRINRQGEGPYTIFTYGWGGDRNIGNFFRDAVEVCNYYMASKSQQIAHIVSETGKLNNEIQVKESAKSALNELGLQSERKTFLSYWNNPEALNVKNVTTNIINPDVDPLADLLINLSGDENNAIDYKTYFFDFQSDGFYNQEGQSLKEFTESSAYDSREILAVVPDFDKSGNISKEIVSAITNPKPSASTHITLPIIKFAETYQIEITWNGYGMGELSHSFNLFPGESKELIIEKSTKKNIKTDESTTTSSVSASKSSSSFEENIKDEFSDTQKESTIDETKKKDITKNSNTSNETEIEDSGFNLGLSSLPGLKILGGGAGYDNRDKDTNTRSSVFEKSQNTETQKATNQSSEVLKKNITNIIDKVASETSQENKLEITSSTSYELEETSSRKEVIKIENPNVGRTINYNFFQLQNIYEITTKLVDVKIILDPGIEIIDGSEMSDIRVFELEEFGKIYPNLDPDNKHSTLLAAMVARQVFKRYAQWQGEVANGNGAVKLKSHYTLDPGILDDLNFSGEVDSKEFLDTLLDRLSSALKQLQKAPFVFDNVELSEKSYKTVNIGAHYLESEIGERPSTEQYLEERRDLETASQKAGLEHLQEQTKAGIYFPNLSNVSTLSLGQSADSLKDLEKQAEGSTDEN